MGCHRRDDSTPQCRSDCRRWGGAYTTGNTIGRPVGHNRGPAHRGGCFTDFGSGTLVPGGIDWRSIGGLPGGFGICGDGVVMQVLSGSSDNWGTGGCVATHGQEVPMAHRSTSWDVVWCRSWDSGLSSPFWCVT